MESQEKVERIRKLIERLVRLEDVKFRMPGGWNPTLNIQNGLGKLRVLFKTRELDDESIVNYLVYQVYRNRRAIADGAFMYTWIFSTNAVDRYRKQFLSADGKSGMNYYINQWLDEFELTRDKLVAMIADPKPNPLRKFVDMPSEEPIKRRFFNTRDGLAMCQASTTGWSPFSEACNGCKNQESCRQITQTKYPELVRLRIENYGKENRK